MRHSAFLPALILGLAGALAACGTRGPLVLPPKPAPATQPAQSAPPTPPADDSKAGNGAGR